jgi:protein required for attachment to host cells
MKPIVTLYLLVNDEDYRLVHTHGDGLAEVTHSKAQLTAAGVTHVQGHSPKEGAVRAHLAKLAAMMLEAEWSKGVYDQIVVSAGPKMLGEIRNSISKGLHGHIVTELHKDLVKLPLHELTSHFKGAISAV